MLDFIAEETASCLARLVFWLVSPVEVEVKSLSCQWVDTNLCDESTVPTGESRQFHAELLLVNRRAPPVSVEGVTLMVNGKKQYTLSGDVLNLQLEAHETRRQPLVFPLSDTDIPDCEGHFKLTVIPASGRTSTVTGTFPVQSK